MRRRILMVGISFVVMVAVASGASAKTITDTNEGQKRDIRSTTLKRPSKGTLAWTVLTYDRFKSSALFPYGFKLFLDTKGTKAMDYAVELRWDTYAKHIACVVEKPDGTSFATGTAARPSARSASCRFPTKGMKITKGIHWRVESYDVGSTDKAPNSGWVVGVG
ncbi:MAG: hypothetical protein ACXVQJ_07750 [Actinomycetota bacterium]